MSKLINRFYYKGKEETSLVVHTGSGETIPLKQVSYNDRSTAHIDGFSVVFEGPESPVLDQGTYTVEHPEAGKGELFLVPVVSPNPKTPRYEFTVSHLRESDSDSQKA